MRSPTKLPRQLTWPEITRDSWCARDICCSIEVRLRLRGHARTGPTNWQSRALSSMSDLANLHGQIAAADQKYDLAEERLRSAVAGQPDNASLAADLARFLSERDRSAEAIEVLDQALGHTDVLDQALMKSDKSEHLASRSDRMRMLREMRSEISGGHDTAHSARFSSAGLGPSDGEERHDPTGGHRWGKKWGKGPTEPSRSPRSSISRKPLETMHHIAQQSPGSGLISGPSL